jgi:hypothetical protein
MPFTVTVERLPRYARFNVSGPASLKNYFDLIAEASRRTAAPRVGKVLVDLRQVVGRLAFTDQVFIGDVVSQKLSHLDRMAVVVPGDLSTYNNEKVAQRRGVSLRNFNDEEAAIAWLLDP